MPRVHSAITARPDTMHGQPMPPRRTLVSLPGVRYWRIRRALFQQQLADLARIHLTTVQRIEAGGPAGMDTVRNLAAALHVDPADLIAQPPDA